MDYLQYKGKFLSYNYNLNPRKVYLTFQPGTCRLSIWRLRCKYGKADGGDGTCKILLTCIALFETIDEPLPEVRRQLIPARRQARNRSASPKMDSSADHADDKRSEGERSTEYAPYPTLTAEDVALPPPPSVAAGPRDSTSMPAESNPYITSSPVSKSTMDTVREALGKFGKKVTDTAKKTEGLAGDVWQHLKTGPSVANVAMGRIGQISKVIAEGGYEQVFVQSFENLPEEKLKKTYACFLSTSAGPVMGVLYLSTAKLAFCSDSPLSYKVGDKTEWSYYKVAVPLHQLRSINPVTSTANPGEKYIQVVSVDNHEFWFMGFVNYDSAVKTLQGAVQGAH